MRLDHIVLNASNLAASAAFYGALLPMIGFEKVRDRVWKNRDGVHLDLRQASEPDKVYARFGPGVNHIAFTTPTRKAVDAIRSALKAKGLEVPDVQILDGAYCLFLKDADGFRVEISCDS